MKKTNMNKSRWFQACENSLNAALSLAIKGENRAPLYVVAPPGVGKSHMLGDVENDFKAKGWKVVKCAASDREEMKSFLIAHFGPDAKKEYILVIQDESHLGKGGKNSPWQETLRFFNGKTVAGDIVMQEVKGEKGYTSVPQYVEIDHRKTLFICAGSKVIDDSAIMSRFQLFTFREWGDKGKQAAWLQQCKERGIASITHQNKDIAEAFIRNVRGNGRAMADLINRLKNEIEANRAAYGDFTEKDCKTLLIAAGQGPKGWTLVHYKLLKQAHHAKAHGAKMSLKAYGNLADNVGAEIADMYLSHLIAEGYISFETGGQRCITPAGIEFFNAFSSWVNENKSFLQENE